ncbi:MAG: hypothetical protein ACLP0L_10475 [Solirubrobacteraceae bacterium]
MSFSVDAETRLARRGMMFARMAGFSVKASYLVGGLMAFYVIAALVSGRYPDPWKAGNGAKVSGVTASWHAAIIAIAAYLILYRLIPMLLLVAAGRAFQRAENAAGPVP